MLGMAWLCYLHFCAFPLPELSCLQKNFFCILTPACAAGWRVIGVGFSSGTRYCVVEII
jgi:hypothetical protein